MPPVPGITGVVLGDNVSVTVLKYVVNNNSSEVSGKSVGPASLVVPVSLVGGGVGASQTSSEVSRRFVSDV